MAGATDARIDRAARPAGESSPSRRQARRAATRAEILRAAWTIVRRDGLTALAMRELGAEVGMRAQSLYGYFPSKHAIYDAMFHQGYEEFRRAVVVNLDEIDTAGFAAVSKRTAAAFVDFCVADPVRHQLLFQRTIPGFEPSPDSYAIAVEVYESTLGRLRLLPGATDADLDLFSAVLSGIAAQQIANDPGGDRWRNLVGDAVDLLLDNIERRRSSA